MICPICGTQQRVSAQCVQCHTPIVDVKKMSEESDLSDIDPSLDESLRPKPPRNPLAESKKEGSVLISTTQRVEGKRIRRYFGLIHASVRVNLAEPDQRTYQIKFKDGTISALDELKKEAAAIGANAVVATTLDTHRIDSEAILLSAIGTAVFLEGPK